MNFFIKIFKFLNSIPVDASSKSLEMYENQKPKNNQNDLITLYLCKLYCLNTITSVLSAYFHNK